MWDNLPDGCSVRDIDDAAGDHYFEGPCSGCGKLYDFCECEACQDCGYAPCICSDYDDGE